MKARPSSEPAGLKRKNLLKSLISDIREGGRIMLGGKRFRWLGFMLLGPMIVHRVWEQMLVPMFAKGVLGSPEKAAWLVSGTNAGELLGALLLLRVLLNVKGGKKSSPFVWVRAMALCGLAVWAVTAGAVLWAILPLILAMSLTWAANDISLTSYLQSLLPNESEGKAMGFLMAAELGAIMIVSYFLGFIFDLLPLSAGLIGISAAFSVLAVFFYKGYARLRSTQPHKS